MTNKKLIYIFIHLLFLYFFQEESFAQEKAKIFGKITDEKNNPIEYVNIGIFDITNPIGITTDHNGKYALTIPANIQLTIIASFTGFESQKEKILLAPNNIKEINFKLKKITNQLPEFVIQDTRTRNSSLNRLNPKNVSQIPSVSGGVESIIKMMPGVSSNNELSSQYNVRGGNYDENLVYVNDIEIYRPLLVRSGQQEGLSFVNSDLVSSILFSAGGFDARYGDKMSSVLDIKYKKPTSFAGNVSMSLLGASMHLEGTLMNSRLSYLIGARQKSNQYLLNSMQTKGEYRPSFTDIQTLLTYDFSEKLELSFLGNYARNIYNVVPENRETDFGTINQALRLKIYFDGQELDRFETFFGALSLNYKPKSNINIKNTISAFQSYEEETFDIQGQYWLSQLEADFGKETFAQEAFNLGVGTYINHARNYLNSTVINFENRGSVAKTYHFIQWGAKYQLEQIVDKLNEWKLVDSSDYTLPNPPDSIGSNNPPHYPLELQNVYKAKNDLSSNRVSGFIQDTWTIDGDTNRLSLTSGIRFSYWDLNQELLVSPRATISYKPRWEKDIVLRFSTGLYYQSPFYRELRDQKGVLNLNLKSQESIHFVAGMDWNLTIWDRPFKFVSEAYYKYLNNLIPYEIDNVRIRYSAKNEAHGYATGIDFRLNGEFVKGIESWASLSIMQTQENIDNDSYVDNNGNTIEPGFIPRPTDQRVVFSLFFQDYLPRIPNIKMHLNLVYGASLPFGPPNSERYKQTLRIPAYRRVDIGSSYLLKSKTAKLSSKNIFRKLETIWISVEVFNLLQISNTISYIWISDVSNRQYAVPNYLTPRQLNVKLVVEF
ncbi:MAG: carboxypeptidase-like regulatory domain-containing protein [Bacteroidetes bacterium]|nr:carboxypeptidase-like regulatory domain-containing protein [Bacteroidota bacterium]